MYFLELNYIAYYQRAQWTNTNIQNVGYYNYKMQHYQLLQYNMISIHFNLAPNQYDLCKAVEHHFFSLLSI